MEAEGIVSTENRAIKEHNPSLGNNHLKENGNMTLDWKLSPQDLTQFLNHKRLLLDKQLEEIQREIDAINNETLPSFVEELQMLEDQRKEKLVVSESWKLFQEAKVKKLAELDKRVIEEEFRTDITSLKERMMGNTMERMKKLSEEKISRDSMNTAAWNERRFSRRVRGENPDLDRADQPAKRRVLPSSIAYKLRDNEVIDDLKLIEQSEQELLKTKPHRALSRR